MADFLTHDQDEALGYVLDEIQVLGRPNQTRYSEDIVLRVAKVLGPATGRDAQNVVGFIRDNPWAMWAALISQLDDLATGYIFQEYASYMDWNNVIVPALRTQIPEKPGVPPEWLIRRMARILDAELPFLYLVVGWVFGSSTEKALAEQPLAVMLLVILFINTFYTFP